jgi:hypothetical protein
MWKIPKEQKLYLLLCRAGPKLIHERKLIDCDINANLVTIILPILGAFQSLA